MKLSRLTLVVPAALVTVALPFSLSGCGMLDDIIAINNPTPMATAMNSSAAETSQSATPALPTATPTVAPAAFTIVGVGCTVFLPDQFVFEIGPNFALDSSYTPDGGSTDAYIASNGGQACRIKNLSGGDHIDVAVAGMTPTGIADVTSNVAATQAEVGDFGSGVRGFFTDAGGLGQATAVTEKYWIVVSSPLFSQARDAAPIIAEVLSKLP